MMLATLRCFRCLRVMKTELFLKKFLLKTEKICNKNKINRLKFHFYLKFKIKIIKMDLTILLRQIIFHLFLDYFIFISWNLYRIFKFE